MPRLYLSSEILEIAVEGDEFDLDADNAKKVVKVLRMTAGETFIGFDGFGREWECALTSVDSDGKPRAKSGNHLLMTTSHPKSMSGIAWTRTFRQSRVFCYQSGHDSQTCEDENFRRIVTNAIEWLG